MNLIFFIVLIAVVLLILFSYIAHQRRKKEVVEIVSRGGIDLLIQKLKEKPNEETIEALGKTNDPRAADALIDFVNSKDIKDEDDSYFFTLGLNALGKIGNDRAIDFLVSLLGLNNDMFVRDYAACVLHSIAHEKGIKVFKAVKPLVTLLVDAKNSNYRLEWTEGALNAITGEKFGKNIDKWEKYIAENREKLE